MKTILLSTVGALGIALAAMPTLPICAANTAHVVASAAVGATAVSDTGFSQARVLQPGTRGKVVEI